MGEHANTDMSFNAAVDTTGAGRPVTAWTHEFHFAHVQGRIAVQYDKCHP